MHIYYNVQCIFNVIFNIKKNYFEFFNPYILTSNNVFGFTFTYYNIHIHLIQT